MIAATPLSGQFDLERASEHWQQQLAEAVTDPMELCQMLQLDHESVFASIDRVPDFILRVPRSFVARMRPGDPKDPLLLQVLPLLAERRSISGYSIDPVGDLDARAAAGILHKYDGRALVIATGACAIHCRYCFRRHFPYGDESALRSGWQAAIAALKSDPTITEAILSGGDPLSLSDRRLRQFTEGLTTVPHVRRLRIHTRYPIVLPDRIDESLLNWLKSLPLQKVVVIHANHVQEINDEVRRACRSLTRAGATVLNQSVLLAGVNDSVDALSSLSEALFGMGVLPYYLHLLDKVQGAAHFDVSEARALDLHAQLASRLPGYLVPRLVREVPGATAKTAVHVAGRAPWVEEQVGY
jgi:EF-P beta-lysylation protein EpmB